MAEELVAIEHVEFVTEKGKSIHLAPGEAVPDTMIDSDVAELRKHKAIGTVKQLREKQHADETAATRQRIKAQALAAGMTPEDLAAED